jgi:hypothetical protein
VPWARPVSVIGRRTGCPALARSVWSLSCPLAWPDLASLHSSCACLLRLGKTDPLGRFELVLRSSSCQHLWRTANSTVVRWCDAMWDELTLPFPALQSACCSWRQNLLFTCLGWRWLQSLLRIPWVNVNCGIMDFQRSECYSIHRQNKVVLLLMPCVYEQVSKTSFALDVSAASFVSSVKGACQLNFWNPPQNPPQNLPCWK